MVSVGKDITKFANETKSPKQDDFAKLLLITQERKQHIPVWIFSFPPPPFRGPFTSCSLKQGGRRSFRTIIEKLDKDLNGQDTNT